LQNDEDIYITYNARINYTNLNNGSVTVNPTQNKVEIHCEQDDNPDNNQKTITNEINYSTISKSNTGIVDDSVNKVKTLTWVILANKEHKTSLSGTIEDKIGDESKDVMSYSGSGIKVIVRDSNDNVVEDDRKISWNGGDDTVGKLTLDTTNKTWKYTIPSGNAGKNYSYEITYTTDVNYKNQTADFIVKNKTRDEYDSNSGTGVITIGDDNKVNYEKHVQKIHGEESIDWTVVVNVPYKENGFSEFVVKDNLPGYWINGNYETDTLDVSSLSVSGLQAGEHWKVSYGADNTWYKYFLITFYKDESTQGLQPNASKKIRTLTISYKTNDNQTWINYAKEDNNPDYLNHRNSVKINNYDVKTATATVGKKNIIKELYDKTGFSKITGEELKKYNPDNSIVQSFDNQKYYYIASYNLFLEGVDTDSLTVHDYFDTDYLMYVKGNPSNNFDKYFGTGQYGYNADTDDGGGFRDAVITSTSKGIDIELPNIQHRKSNDDYFTRYGVRYCLVIKPEKFTELCELAAKNGGELPIKNTATWLDSTSSVDANFKFKVVDKTVNTDDTAKPKYKIVINREKSRLNEGNVMQLTDTFTNQIIDLSTIQITTDPESKKSEVKYALEKDKLLFTIPDETKVTIEYRAFVTGSGKVSYSNTAELTGGYYDETTRNVQIESSAVGGASLVYIKLNKYDITNPAKKLAGAKFKLENEDGSAFTDNGQEMVFVTNEKGQIVGATNGIKSISFDNTNFGNTSESLGKNTVYYLEEIEAPEEYALLDKKIGFIFADNDYTDHQDEDSYIDDAGNEVYIFRSVNGIFNISNKKGEKYLLPATGSRGTSWIYLLGSIILLMAAELYFLKRKEVDRR
jgi:LPXTG-motif cell wall-anchored protein